MTETSRKIFLGVAWPYANGSLHIGQIVGALTKKWPAQHWRLAFQGNLHEIPESDYKRIEGLMRQAGLGGGRDLPPSY